ncbi:MAG: hypothetical protein ACM3PZ_04065 [Bacillota bacterium]
MKDLVVLLLLTVAPLANFAQKEEKTSQLYNQSGSDITIFYQERAITVPANSTAVWPGSPPAQFIAYVVRKLETKETGMKCYQKIGFVRFTNDKGLIIFDNFLRPLPVYIKNGRNTEISLEYFDKAVFIPAGLIKMLPDSYINSDKTADYMISEQTKEGLSKPERIIINLEVRLDKIYGEIP